MRRPPILPLLLALLLIAFLVLPVLVLLFLGARAGLGGAGSSAAVLEALRVSLWSTGLTVLLSVTLGLPVAYLLARHRFPGARLLDTLLDLPVVLPPVVAGLGLLFTFGRGGLLGPGLSLAGIELAFSPLAVVLAQLFVAAPFFVRAAKIGFLGIERDLEGAARVDGASPGEVFRLITLPLALPALLEGLALCWARALGEFGATILFAGSLEGRTRTLTLSVYSLLESDLGAALFLSGLMCLFAFGMLLLLRLLGQDRSTV